MAIAIDTTTNPDAGGGSAPSPFTWSHTTSGTNRLLTVFLDLNSPGSATAVTYNGVQMTQMGTDITIGGRTVQLWYLLNPASGANIISVTFTGSFLRVAAASYTGVKQTGQPEVQAQNATGSSQAVTTTSDNDWLIGFGVNDAGAVGVGANTTLRVNTGGNTSYAIIDSNAAQTPAGSHSLTITGATPAINVGGFAPAGGATPVNSGFFFAAAQ